MVVRAFILVAVLAALAIPFGASAQERVALSPRQTEIMRMVAQAEGYVTPDLHREFWNGFAPEIRGDPHRVTRLAVDFAYLPAVYGAFERELWSSAKLSLEKRDLLSTADYSASKQRLSQFIDVAAFEATPFASAVAQADNILRAAASGSDFANGNATMKIDAAFIDVALAGLDAAQSRLTRLLDPSFPTRPKEFRYPDGHFRIFWPDPLIESRVAIPEGGYGREVVVYANRYDRDVYLSVQFLSLFSAEDDPVRAIVYGKLVASQMGFAKAEAVAAEWEEHASAIVNAVAVIDGKNAELSLRLVLAPEHEGAWVMVCLSESQQGFAQALRENLDAAVRPD